MSQTLNASTVTPVINFTQIPPPGQLLVPGAYIEILPNYTNVGLLPLPARALIIGQAHSTGSVGSATNGTVYNITNTGQPTALFGNGSPLAEAIAYFQQTNPGIPIDAIGQSPTGGSVAAAGSITFGGSATYNGTQALAIAGFRIPFNIATTDTPANMAANFVAAAGAIANAQNSPVILATNSTVGQVTVTARYLGALGNNLDVRVNPAQSDVSVPGVTTTIVPIGTTTAGSGLPNIQAVLGVIATTWYTDIITTYNDPTSLADLMTAVNSNYTAMQNVDSTVYGAISGTQAQIASAGAAIDCPFMVLLGVTNPQDPFWRWAATLGGVAAQEFLTDPARQLRGLVLPNIIAPAPADRLYEPEQQALLAEGVSTYTVAPDLNVLIQRLVSTYTTSNLGVPDTSWQDIMTAKVMTRIRWDWKNYLLLNYPNAKLAPDGSVAAEYDPSIATPKRIQASWAARCQLYERAGWIVNAAETVAQSVFYIDPNDKNRLDSQRQLNIIGNYMVDAEQMLFAA